MSEYPVELQPTCHRCTRRHLPSLPCWSGRYVERMRALVLATYGDACCHCGRPGSTSPEHVHPRSLGGTDAVDNLRPAHLTCNLQRGTRPMPGFGVRPITVTSSARW